MDGNHFFKIMLGDFRTELRIPRQVSVQFKEKTGDRIVLRGPRGNATTVELMQEGEDYFFIGTMKTPHVEKANYPLYFKSNRRRVTDEEKRSTYQIASRHLKGPSFLVRMQPSHVRHGFTLTIPKLWADSNLPSNLQEIQLGIRTSKKLWAVKYRRSTQNMLVTGWSKFVFDNNIEEDDVCVFELRRVSQGKPVIFDVHIFRVVNEVVPLSEYRPAKNSRNG